MEGLAANLNIYLIPPVLFLLTGFSIAIFSLAKGKRQRDTVTFALMCLWWSLLSIAFIAHHIFKGNPEIIMTIERMIHCVYVFIPAIGVQFFHAIISHRNRAIVIVTLIVSALVSISTFSDYYIFGLWEYRWGYIAKGGVVFQFFGVYSLIITIYGIVLFIEKMRTETDPAARLKLLYLMVSMFIIAFMSLCNIPAMNGIDIYPPGNFAFIPMLLMAWGIYRYDVIRINPYAKRRIIGTIVRVKVLLGFIALLLVAWWALIDIHPRLLLEKSIPYGIPPLLSFISCLFLSIMGLRVGANRRESFVFSFIALAYTYLSLDIFINIVIDDAAHGLSVSRISHVLVVFLPALLVHLMRIIAGRTGERYVQYVFYAMSAAMVPFTQTDWYLAGMHRYSWGFFAKKAFLFDVLIFLSALATLYSVFILAIAYRRSAYAYVKRRILFFLLGSTAAAVMSMGNFPAMNGMDIYPVGNFIFIPMILFATGLYLYNRDEMLRFASGIMRYGGLALVIGLMAWMLMGAGRTPALFITSSVALVAIIVFNYYWKRLCTAIFRGRTVGLNRAFEMLGDVLSKSRSYIDISSAVSTAMFTELHAEYCIVLFYDAEDDVFHGQRLVNTTSGIYLDDIADRDAQVTLMGGNPLLDVFRERRSFFRQEEIEEWLLYHERPVRTDDPIRLADASLPVYYEDRLVCMILLGPKTDGSVYTEEEAKFMYNLGLSLGAYIENARILQQLETTIQHRTKELRASEENYRLIVDNASDMIYRMDITGRCIFANPVILTILGITRENLYGHYFWEFIPKSHRRQVVDFYAKQVKDNIPETQLELPIVSGSGEILWINQIVKTVGSGGKREYQCIARDVTARKKADDARRELEEQKSRFFANISHEIRTPLTLMLSPIESVLQGSFDMRVDRDFFLGLHRNGLRLLKLINNLLDFAKIEAGRMTLRVAPVDIVSFMRRFEEGVRSAMNARGLSLSIETPEEPLILHLDEEKIDKTFMNLFSNAIKFTKRSGKIFVRIIDCGHECRIEFEDTGIGIPADKLGIVFDRFSQADAGSTRQFEGTGIGLALAREFVEMHGGTIAVESRDIETYPDNHGTVFSVVFPKGTEHLNGRLDVEFFDAENRNELAESIIGYDFADLPESGAEGSSADCEDSVQAKSTHAKSILVIDDNADMRSYLTRLLQNEYRVYCAENGESGLSMARKVHPDLLLTDVMMPVMNGFELTERIRSDPELRSTPVIMLTANADLTGKISGLSRGADDYLVKPFNPIELITRVASLLKNYEYQRMLVKRNREIESDLEVARLIVERLLPEHLPAISGYRSHVTYLPMDKVGGDFYDFRFDDRSGNLELFIADVSGHGLPGAFLALITKMALESVTGTMPTDRVLGAINEVVRRSTVKSNYVTAFFGRIDTEHNVLRYSSAGHLPPILYRMKDEEFILLQTKGKPLGWIDRIALEEKEIALSKGDRIIFYTDGITECINQEREIFGDEGFLDFIRQYRVLEPQEFSRQLIATLHKFASSDHFNDDLTMIVLDVE
jgi:PAS domain S-box-containing protein